MADLSQLLPEIGKLLGLTPQPAQPAIAGPPSPAAQPPAAGAPGGPAPAPTAGGGLVGLLSNPIAETALQGYLGYLAAPRGGPRWQRIGEGGLAGLRGFQQAEAQQLAIPQAQATLQKTQAEAKKTVAETGMTEAEAQYFKNNPDAAAFKYGGKYAELQQIKQANTKLAAAWSETASRSPGMDPNKVKSVAAQAAASDSPLKSEDLIKAYYGDEEAQSKLNLQQAMTGQVGKAKPELAISDTGEVMELRPGMVAPGAHKLGAPLKPNYQTYKDESGATHTIDVNTEAPAPTWRKMGAETTKSTIMTDAALDAEATKRATAELGHAPTPGLISHLMGSDKAFADKFTARQAEIKRQLLAERAAGGAAGVGAGRGPTEADLATLPPGWKLDTKPNPVTGHPDAIAPDGVTHKPWTPD